MGTSPSTNDPTPPPDRSTVILLLADIADTTWRMFVPTIAGAVIGWWIGSMIHTETIAGLIGLALGIIVSGLLVRDQFRKIRDKDKV